MTVTQRFVVLTLALALPGFGQGVPVLKRGNFELGGFAAFTFGGTATPNLDFTVFGLGKANYAPPQSNGGGGVHIGVAMSKRVMVFGEFGYLSGGQGQIVNDSYTVGGPGVQRLYAQFKSSAVQGEGGLEVRFPTSRAPKLVPYLSLGAGVLRTTGSLSQGSIGDSPPGLKSTFSGSLHVNSTIGSGGGGVRYFFTEHAGLRAEVKGFGGQHDLRFGRLVFGLFYQFR
jgi:hypothetical protein